MSTVGVHLYQANSECHYEFLAMITKYTMTFTICHSIHCTLLFTVYFETAKLSLALQPFLSMYACAI